MPMTKLTLSADKRLVREAKRVAAAQNTSLSAMIDRLLRAVTAKPEETKLGPLTKSVMGIAKVPDKSVQELLTDALWDKYGDK